MSETLTMCSRKSVRLKSWDYASAGSYFVTMCTHNRQCLFGTIVSGNLSPSDLGFVAITELQCLPEHYDHVAVDCSIVMPNHVHAVIVIGGAHRFSPVAPLKNTANELPFKRPSAGSLSAIVRSYKAGVTRIARAQGLEFTWQSGFYEHIIRSDKSLNAIRAYIEANPRHWRNDRENLLPDFSQCCL